MQPHLRDTFAEFRDRVSSFAAEFDSTAAAIEARSSKLRLEEEKAEEVRKELERKKDELEKAHQAVKRKSTEFEAREEGFEVLMKKEIAVRRKLEELVGRLREEIEAEKAEKASVGDRLKEAGVREEELESLGGYLELKAIQVREGEEAVEEKRKEVEAKEKEINEQFQEFRSREKKFEEQLAEFREKQAEFEVRIAESNAKEREISNKDKQCREPEMNARPWSYELMEKKLEEKFNMLSKRIDELELQRMKNSESIEKQVEMRSGDTVLKIAKRPVEPLDHSSEPKIKLCVITRGKDLQILLNEHSNDYDSVKDEVYSTLKLSSDPAKLVLDAMEGFYPPHLKKDGIEFEDTVVRKSCLLLLEWMTEMSPPIEPTTEEEALDLAREWKGKMKSDDAEHSLEVVAFLQLLSAFNLLEDFRDEVVDLLCIIAHHRQAPWLMRDLECFEQLARLIEEKLRNKEHRDEAAELIAAFALDTEFPGVFLPESICKVSNPPHFLGKNGAAPTISAYMSSSTGLRAPKSPTQIGKCSGAKRSWSEACGDDDDTECPGPQQPDMSNVIAQQPVRLSGGQDCSNPISINSKGSEEDKGNYSENSEKDNENDIEDCEEEDEDESLPNVLSFVPQCFENGGTDFEALCKTIGSNRLRCIEISDALRLSPDPAKFVLGVVRNPSSLQLKCGIRSISFKFPGHGTLLLLHYLWRLSPYIKPEVRWEALSFAKDWKSKLADEIKDDIDAVSFLLFLAAYKLQWYFDTDELFSVFSREFWCIPTTELLVILGLKNFIPMRQFLGYLVRNHDPEGALTCLEKANMFESDPSARSRLCSYLLKPTSGASYDKRITDINRELAVWKDVVDHKLVDESCRSHIKDLEKKKRELQDRKYSRTQARYSALQQRMSTTTGAATPAVTSLSASPSAPSSSPRVNNVAATATTPTTPSGKPQPEDKVSVAQDYKRNKVSADNTHR